LSDLDPDESDIEASRAPLLDHLVELRKRLIISVAAVLVGFVVCFAFSEQIYIALLHPFEIAAQLLAAQKQGHSHGAFDLLLALIGVKEVPSVAGAGLKLVFTAPLEFFFTKLKLAGFGAVMLTFPVLAWQVYAFVAPGLYKRERNAFLPFLIASPILFLLGASLVYFFFTPMVMWFFLSMQQAGGDGQVQISLLPKVSEYLSLIMTLIFSFGLVFQLPVVTSLMARVGLLTSKGLAEKRKWAIVLAFIAAAVLTPPDPISQIGLALPTIILYEVSIWSARMIERSRERERLAREAKEAAEAAAEKAAKAPVDPAAPA
jgi:sec-independent protein translocase protein TatC